jgi:hypothetical protein
MGEKHWTESGKYGPHRPIASIEYRDCEELEDDMNYIALNSGQWACDTVIYQGTYGYLCVYNYVPEVKEHNEYD